MTPHKIVRRVGVWVGCLMLAGCGKSEPAAPTAASAEVNAPATTPSPAAVAASGAKSNVILATHTAPVAPSPPADVLLVLHTSLGNLTVRLYEKQAPRTVNNFLDYARGRHYDGTLFHLVDSGYVAVGGGYDVNLQLKPVRYPIANEAKNGLKNVRGALTMARDPRDANSATSQFFINLADNPQLDHRGESAEEFGYCVFGQVVDGLDVLDKMNQAQTGSQKGFDKMPTTPIVLHTIKAAPPRPLTASNAMPETRYTGTAR
jgi:cyclophilin family peptidyl-prolyl cis-trans isomerase